MGAAVIPGSSPAGSGVGEAEDCWERWASAGRPGWGLARGVLPSAPAPHDTKGPLSSLQAAGKGPGWWLFYAPCFVCKGNRLWLGGCLSPSLGKAQEHSQRNPEKFVPCPQALLQRPPAVQPAGISRQHAEGGSREPFKGRGQCFLRTASSDLTQRLLDWLAPPPTAFSFPSRLFSGDPGSGSRRRSAATAGTEGGSRA